MPRRALLNVFESCHRLHIASHTHTHAHATLRHLHHTCTEVATGFVVFFFGAFGIVQLVGCLYYRRPSSSRISKWSPVYVNIIQHPQRAAFFCDLVLGAQLVRVGREEFKVLRTLPTLRIAACAAAGRRQVEAPPFFRSAIAQWTSG